MWGGGGVVGWGIGGEGVYDKTSNITLKIRIVDSATIIGSRTYA